MKKQTKESQSTPREPTVGNNVADEQLPQEVLEAARIDAEFNRLAAVHDATSTIAETAPGELHAALVDADLNSAKDLQQISVLHTRSVLAPLKVAHLQDLLDDLKKSLKSASYKAATIVNKMCAEAARGHQEIAAQAIASHFGSLQDARRASRESPGATAWLDKRISNSFHDGASMDWTLRVAREVFPELCKLREQLGGSIPSGSEMNEP
jgi:hypothetical protein